MTATTRTDTSIPAVPVVVPVATTRQANTPRGAISYYDFGGPRDAPLLHFAHANGFNGLTYRHVLAPLTQHFRVLAWDARGHGWSRLPADAARLRSWQCYRDDLLALMTSLGEPLYLSGHSLGGATSILAASNRPEQVRGLLLLEPVTLSLRYDVGLMLGRASGLAARFHPLAKKATRRRWHFPDVQAVVTAYAGRSIFRTWPHDVVVDYAHGGTVAHASGGVALACTPAWEAATYTSAPPRIWHALSHYHGPMTLLYGSRDSTCGDRMAARIARLKPDADVRRVDGASHFLPMERADLVEQAALALLARSKV